LVRLFVLGLLVGVAGASAASAGQERTVVHHYVAFKDGRLAPGLTVRASVPGYCWSTSVVEGRRYTWRCIRGNAIHDPCFSAKPRSRFVVCPDAPWSKRVLVLRLTRPLPPWKVYGGHWRKWPWGVTTADGKHCFTLAGTATGEVAGMRDS
jgi:hypothetical protein